MTDEAQANTEATEPSPEEKAIASVGRIVQKLRDEAQEKEEAAAVAALSPEVRVKRLIELQQRHALRHAEECPFKPGDLVTPMANCMYSAGETCVVLEVLERELVSPVIFEPVGSIGFGMQPDIRVAAIPNGQTPLVYWVESWMWDRFVVQDQNT